MRIKIRDNDVALYAFLLVLITKIQSRLESPLYDDNLMLIFLAGILVVCGFWGRRGRVNKTVLSLGAILIVYSAIFTFLIPNNSIIEYIHAFFLAFMAYVLIVFSVSMCFGKRNAWKLLRKAYAVISGFLIITYIIFFDNFSTFRNLSSLLLTNRTRTSFGFTHANTTADICLAVLSLSLMLRVAYKNKMIQMSSRWRKYMMIADIIIWVMLISTTSRGGIIAGIVMYLCYLYMTIDKYIANRSVFKVIKPLIIMIIGILLLIVIYFSLIKTGDLDISYRLKNFTVNLPTLIQNNRLLFGWGFVDKGVFANGRIISGTGYVDNYYLYVLVTTGIVGCLFILGYVYMLIKSIKKVRNNPIKQVIFSILWMQFIFCLTEADFINPASVFSMVAMIIYLTFILEGFNRVEEKE